MRHSRVSVCLSVSPMIVRLAVFALWLFAAPQAAWARSDSVKISESWREAIGSKSGTPVVANDIVLLGTNNRVPRLREMKGDHGVMMAFRLDTGAFLGQVTHEQLGHRSNDLNGSVLCRPRIDGNRAFYVSNRGEMVSLDLTAFNPKAMKQKVAWSLDFVGKLGVFKRDASDIRNPLSSPVVIGDLVYAVTGNGAAFGYARTALAKESPFVPKPEAPSFIAVDKKTGKLAWSSSAPGKDIQYGQWGSPAHAKVGETDQVLFPGGDGRLYGFEAKTGKLIWKVDCNPATATRWDGGNLGTRTSFMAAPVVGDGVAYIGTAIDLERTDVPRPLYAVEVTHKGDATKRAILWTYYDDDFGGTFGNVALGKGTLYALGGSGQFVCLNPKTGKVLWRRDLGANAKWFGSAVVHSGMVFVAAGHNLFVFEDGLKMRLLGKHRMDDEITGNPAVSHGRILVATRKHLHCLALSLSDLRSR